MGYSPWGRKESDTTERLYLTLPYLFMHGLCALTVERHKVRRKGYLPSSQDTRSLMNGTGLELGAFGGLGESPASLSPLPPLPDE